jgi:hypothetical protein
MAQPSTIWNTTGRKGQERSSVRLPYLHLLLVVKSLLGLLLSYSAPNVESFFFFSFLSVRFFPPKQRTGLLLFHRLILALDGRNGQISEMEEVHSTFGRFSCCRFSSVSSSSALNQRFHHCYFRS